MRARSIAIASLASLVSFAIACSPAPSRHASDAGAETDAPTSRCCPPDHGVGTCTLLGGWSVSGSCPAACDLPSDASFVRGHDAHGCEVWTYQLPPASKGAAVGERCATSADCDSALGLRCSNETWAHGPLDPTPVCTQEADASCEPLAVACDRGRGVCVDGASCLPGCAIDDAGTMRTACAGANACRLRYVATDPGSGRRTIVGSCGGGCGSGADCPSGSTCDPTYRVCLSQPCPGGDADCAAAMPGVPSYVCDAARGRCTFRFAKKVGDECDRNAKTPECWCEGGAGAPIGHCSASCRTGHADDCPAGFVCDPRFEPTDPEGTPIVLATMTLPAGVNGRCLPRCTMDLDCLPGHTCKASPGMGDVRTCQ
jgi:hypothetical protein